MRRASKDAKNRTSYRIIYGDTDQMAVAYYANYLRWFEMGRTEFLRQIDVTYTSIEERGLHFPVTEASCRYFRPARYDETITIETCLVSLGRASLAFSYRVLRNPGNTLLAEGRTKHACIDRAGRIVKLPPELASALHGALSPVGGTRTG
jgi:acyl-CoA thioester hydrolase